MLDLLGIRNKLHVRLLETLLHVVYTNVVGDLTNEQEKQE
jgi:hypothetical protein